MGQIRSKGGRTRLRAAALAAIALVATGAAASSVGQAQNPPDQISRRTRLRSGPDDPNVKVASEINVRTRPSQVAAPVSKTPTGKVLCSVMFDNYTDLFTKTYIDGQYAGTIRPFGELTASASPGATVLYARAEYDDGSADAWGPIRVTCKTKYTWRLTD
jgi:hypothetical protein